MIEPSVADVAGLFDRLDPAPFVPRADAGPRPASPGPIRTYRDETGLTLSAISDRGFMAWIVGSLVPLAGRRVLEIGSGTGYLAYALAQLTGDEGSVHGCEIIPELFEASLRNPLIRATPSITLHAGDFVDVVPKLGQFDVVIATSAMSNLHPTLLEACRPDGGRIALPIEIQGGGDCYTIFRRDGATLRTVDAKLSVSVPTTGRYSPDPAWAVPVRHMIPNFDASKLVRVDRPSDLGHPVYGTLALRSFLQAHEPLFSAVSLEGDDRPFIERVAFGLLDPETESFCLQRMDQWLLGGPGALTLAKGLELRIQEWKTHRKPSLADFRYELRLDPPRGVSFLPAVFARADDPQRI